MYSTWTRTLDLTRLSHLLSRISSVFYMDLYIGPNQPFSVIESNFFCIPHGHTHWTQPAILIHRIRFLLYSSWTYTFDLSSHSPYFSVLYSVFHLDTYIGPSQPLAFIESDFSRFVYSTWTYTWDLISHRHSLSRISHCLPIPLGHIHWT